MKMFVDVTDIYLHKAPVDFRKGINGLSLIVEQHMNPRIQIISATLHV